MSSALKAKLPTAVWKTLDPEEADRQLDERGYFILRDAGFAEACREAAAEYRAFLAQCPLHPTSEKFHPEQLAQAPWRKLAIGSRNGVGENYAQNLQSIYFDQHLRNAPGLSFVFEALVELRNRLMRLDSNFGAQPRREGFWNACRVHHYPRGGGFMSMHRDTHFPKKLDGKPFYQVCALLSEKGRDFKSGGGFVVGADGRKVDLESEGGFGSLAVFDGRTFHGVDDVDLDQVLDFSRSDGRLAAFVSLYNWPTS